MPKGRGGRPKKDDGGSETRQVRVFTDVADMLGWISFFEGKTVAQILDALVRDRVVTLYQPYIKEVERIKSLQKGNGE